MARIILSNSFSLNMVTDLISKKGSVCVKVTEIGTDNVKRLISGSDSVLSVIGHASTSQILSYLLGIPVPVNRVAVQLSDDDVLITFQLLTRLAEGQILTPEEISQIPFKFYMVEIIPCIS